VVKSGLRSRSAPATVPAPGFPGLDPRWSRLVSTIDPDGVPRTFHVLDSWAGGARGGAKTADPDATEGQDEPIGTLLCVHGNPTWSYLWRRLLAAAPPGWRVVAPDQLGMGYSDRTERPRVLTERVDDLGRLAEALGITGPGRSGQVVTVAHDWGGIISLGWGLQHLEQLRGVVLMNTAVHQPAGNSGPTLIRLARVPFVTDIACRLTPLFVRATTSLTWPRLPRNVRAAFAAPYRTISRRMAVGDFVADIPFAADHPSHPAVERIAEATAKLEVPALLLWGPRDPVFGEVHLRDLQERLPHAALHRYESAGHLLAEDAPGYAAAVAEWVGQRTIRSGTDRLSGLSTSSSDKPSALAQLVARRNDDEDAVVEVGGRTVSWAQLHADVGMVAAGLTATGVRPGDRVALLIPPSVDLTVALYAVWRAGGVIVVADKGLGLRGMGRALRGARLDFLIADSRGLPAARLMRLPGERLRLRGSTLDRPGFNRVVRTLSRSGWEFGSVPEAAADEEAAVLFTSGATGPAKGVLYRHRQLRAQLDLIRTTYRLTFDDRIVAAFAPFALYGPALGLPSVVPRTDVTKPGRLTATALSDAAAAIDATVVFASPAALRNVVATASGMSESQRIALRSVRLVMSAGASVPAQLLRQVAKVLPNAELHTPYGMTEALPLTDVSLREIEQAGEGDGVCVGRPLPGVSIRIAQLDGSGVPAAALTAEPGASGEIWGTAAHIRDRYDAAWVVDQAAAAHPGWHRTGDVGYLDESGRLWVQGRMVHVITTADGPVTPVGIELRVERALGSAGSGGLAEAAVAVVGVGPVGTQQVVVVLTGASGVPTGWGIPRRAGPLAPTDVIDAVRKAAGTPVAAVLITKALPVDIRHNSKIDRVAVSAWASKVLAGG